MLEYNFESYSIMACNSNVLNFLMTYNKWFPEKITTINYSMEFFVTPIQKFRTVEFYVPPTFNGIYTTLNVKYVVV